MTSLIHKGPSLHEQDDGMPSHSNNNVTSNFTLYEPLHYFKAYSFVTTEKSELQATASLFEVGLGDNPNFSFFVKVDESAPPHMKIPVISDKETIKSLAKMASNSLFSNGKDDLPFYPFDYSEEKWDRKAIRGYVYTNPSRKLVVFSIDGNVPYHTSFKSAIEADKFNNNLMFSCCCARVDFTWDTICPCSISGSSCSKTCLSDYAQELRVGPFAQRRQDPDLPLAQRHQNHDPSIQKYTSPIYYHQAVKIYKQLLKEFPEANIWVTGHSTGGSLAALLGLAFPGTPVVAFGSPGERLFALRLGLLNEEDFSKTEDLPIFHFYDSADPIPNGECMRLWSPCYLAGYAFESKCHLGKVCKLQSVNSDLSFDIQAHKLSSIIANIDMQPLPQCVRQETCTDCDSWTFV